MATCDYPGKAARRRYLNLYVMRGRMMHWRYLLSLGAALLAGALIGFETRQGMLFESSTLLDYSLAWGAGGGTFLFLTGKALGVEGDYKQYRRYRSAIYLMVLLLAYTAGFLLAF